MRRLIIFVLPLALLGRCTDIGSAPRNSPAVFMIDLQAQFLDDSVRVLVDDRMVYEGRVTTFPLLGLARSIPVEGVSGTCWVRTQVVDPLPGTERDTAVTVGDTLTVAVTLDERSRTLYYTVYPYLIRYR